MTTAPDPIRALAEAQVGRCHLCAFLRQEHRDGMGHRPDARIGVDPRTVLAILDERDALRAFVARVAGISVCSQTHHEHLGIAARALLARAASPGQGL